MEIDGQWQCDRPATRGGACDDGPTPDGKCCRAQQCRPVRSMRTVRGVLVRSAMIFTVGVALMMLGSSRRNGWLAPGPLTSSHSQVLQGEGWNNRCNNCHAAAEQSVGTWLTAAVGQSIGPTQSTKCLACHGKTIEPTLALVAHNVPADLLAALDGDSLHQAKQHNLACSVCHQEHHGADHDLAAMSDTRCQTCHTQQYASFASDHPDFAMWPYQRRTRIAFNHATHSGKHFAEKNQTFTCSRCHVEDESRHVQLTLGYDVSCAECHNADIATTTAGGVTLLTMPMLDTDLLADEGVELKNWPERATGDFDGKLPAMMKLLLAQEPKTLAAMEQLGADFDFFDVDPDDPQQLEAAGTVAKAIEKLLEQLSSGELAKSPTVQGLTPELVKLARRQWTESDTPDEDELPPMPGSWQSDPVSLTLRYEATGHADPVLRAWYDAIVHLPPGELRGSLLAEFTSTSAPGRCATCHSIEATAGDNLVINWHAQDPRDEPRGFTRFSHGPHLLPLELRDCTACHTLDPAAGAAHTYTGHNPAAFTTEFLPVTKATCAACHNKSAVGESCTQCHNYHVDAASLR